MYKDAAEQAKSVKAHVVLSSDCMPKTSRNLFHLAILCDDLMCGFYGSFCYGTSRNVIEKTQQSKQSLSPITFGPLVRFMTLPVSS